MLRIPPSILAQVILFGRELPRAEAELRGLIDALDVEARIDLIVVMWIGRDSFDAEELSEARAVAAVEATTPTADYLLGTPHFAAHLEAGMEALGLDPVAAEAAIL